MAEAIGSAAGGHPDLNLSTEEKRVYGELLKEADPDGFGAVSGDVAVKFFERTKLPPDVLGQIWQIADTENRGFLTPAGFGVVLRLIGHAQAGRVPATSLAPSPAPLPRFDSINRPPPAAAPLSAQTSGTPSSPTTSGPGPIRVPALTPEKVNEYSAVFEKSGAENGALSGVIAKQIFERARLPNEILGRIWNLADTQGRGFLDVTEFVVAMHLLASCKSGAMRGVPNTLPSGLYDAAARRPPPRIAASPRPTSASGYASTIPPQFSGYGGRSQSPITPQFSGFGARTQSPRQSINPPLSAQSTGDAWVISPADKARFDQIFSTIDRQGLGYIDGNQAVGFFSNARLPEESLAQIWDLADINSEGRLNKDEFAVAMYLIRQQRGTKDGRGNLPATLPQNLVPPGMRKQVIPPSQPTAPTFDTAPTQPRSAADDLFGLDVLSPTQPSASQTSQVPAQDPVLLAFGGQASQSPTVSREVGSFGAPTSPTVPPAAAAAASSIFKPFQPSSSFGQSMIPRTTGFAASSQPRSNSVQHNEDLLGDTDAAVSSRLTNDTAELGNLSNQVGNLSKEMTDLQGKRTQADQELASNVQQKQTFETRLSQLRTAFDKEVKEFKALQEQLTTSKNENKRLQQDIAMIEGSHADTKRQHDSLRAAFEADQQENTSLKERIRQINAENDQLKPQIEKIKSDARQQKGMVAINKKQLATNELERDRLQNEIKAANQEVEGIKKEIDETNRQIEASKKELEEASRQAAAAKKALEEARAMPKPTMPAPAPVVAPVPVSAPAPESVPVAETTRSQPLASPPLASPTPSTISNPFTRRDGSTFFSPPIGSPEPTHDHSAFDSIFGPSFGAAAAAPETSFRSETPTNQIMSHERVSQNEIHTPASSTAPDIIEPPAPPSGRGITSGAIPLRVPLERTESMTSSVKVIPPASWLSSVDTPRATKPGYSTPGTDKHSSDLFAAAPDEEQESVRQTLPRWDTNEKSAGIPGAFPAATPRSETPSTGISPATIAVGAGAAAVAVGAGIAAAVTSQEDNKQTEKKIDSPVAETSATTANNFDEYFGGPAHQRTASQQVKDFDDAFAGMNAGSATTNGTAKAANMEFPDIQEIDAGDDSSIYSEETPLGFDDDFSAGQSTNATNDTGAVPGATAISSTAAGKQPEIASAIPSRLQPRPQLDSTGSATSLPGIEQQSSPPTYGDSVPQDNPSHFPREYKGLLPEREDPTSPPFPTAGGSSHPGPNPSGAPPAYGPEVARTQEEAIEKTRSSSAAKPPAFDFDSAFAGMGSAQVHEDESDEEETVFGSRGHQVPEFDPSFASPAESRAGTVASVTHSPMTTHDAVTNGSAYNPSASSNTFFGFNDSIVSAPPPPVAGTTNASAISHDWGALFAPLSSPPPAEPSNFGRPISTQRTQISPEVSAQTTAAEVSGTSTPIPGAAKSTAPLPSSFLRVERPQPGRALSTGTEHDDPILKQLTSMGWNRNESLAALEKFDYNIDKAADYLTFKS